jgi:hypothetical protein
MLKKGLSIDTAFNHLSFRQTIHTFKAVNHAMIAKLRIVCQFIVVGVEMFNMMPCVGMYFPLTD